MRQIAAFALLIACSASASAGFTAQDQTPRPPLRVGGAVKAPVKIKNVEPVYPARAQEERIEGVVIVELLIGESGAVQEAKVLRSVPTLDEAALEAVLQWVYMPTLLNGQPVSLLYNVTITFSLK